MYPGRLSSLDRTIDWSFLLFFFLRCLAAALLGFLGWTVHDYSDGRPPQKMRFRKKQVAPLFEDCMACPADLVVVL